MPTSGPHQAANVTHPGGMGARRVFPTDRREHLDPFVVFERFFIDPDQGFDTHPHRGFEIVSYMLDGEMAHADSMGHESVAGPGGAMRITTGSGTWEWLVPDGWNGFAYAVAGDGAVDGDPVGPAECVLVEGGDELAFSAGEELRIAAVAGTSHGEPIRQRGPFVE